MKIRDEIIELIHERFPDIFPGFTSLCELERSLRYEDSDEVEMMEKYLNISWRDVTTQMLRYNSEAFYLFNDIAYSKFLPSVLMGSLINYDDTHGAFFCLIRDIADYDSRRRNVFESIMTLDQLGVIIRVINFDNVSTEFRLYESPSTKISLITKASYRLGKIIEHRRRM